MSGTSVTAFALTYTRGTNVSLRKTVREQAQQIANLKVVTRYQDRLCVRYRSIINTLAEISMEYGCDSDCTGPREGAQYSRDGKQYCSCYYGALQRAFDEYSYRPNKG